jgi:hypothetical protein
VKRITTLLFGLALLAGTGCSNDKVSLPKSTARVPVSDLNAASGANGGGGPPPPPPPPPIKQAAPM